MKCLWYTWLALCSCHKMKWDIHITACMQVLHYTVDKHIREGSTEHHVTLWQVFSEQHLSERFNLVPHVFWHYWLNFIVCTTKRAQVASTSERSQPTTLISPCVRNVIIKVLFGIMPRFLTTLITVYRSNVIHAHAFCMAIETGLSKQQSASG
jgi:hypothetical protein